MKSIKITTESSSTFGKDLLTALAEHPFGSLSKLELEILVFSKMKDAGLIGDSESNFSIARILECSKAKVDSMLYAYRNRSISTDDSIDAAGDFIKVADLNDDKIIFNIEEQFYKELFIDRLKNAKIYSDSSFNRERVSVPGVAFMINVGELFPGKQSDELHQRLSDEIGDLTPEKLATPWEDFAKATGDKIKDEAVSMTAKSIIKFFIEYLS